MPVLKNFSTQNMNAAACLFVAITYSFQVHAQEATPEQPSDVAATIEQRLSDTQKVPGEEKSEQVDLAFGAFQRGYYLTAFNLALPRANLGEPAAQTLIAEMYERGLGVARNLKESTAWYGIAAKNGDVEAQFSYAVKLLEGKYVKPDKELAREMMKTAANAGHASAAFNYGQMIIDRRPTSAGTKEALAYFEKAAAAGTADAFYILYQIYSSGKLKGYPEYEVAQEWLFQAASAGIDTAQVELAIWLLQGKAGLKDEKVAFQWMKRAAIGGNVVGQNRLAKMYVSGSGAEHNPIEAVKWYIISRRAGLNDQQLDGFMRSLDQKDLSKALEAANRWPSG